MTLKIKYSENTFLKKGLLVFHGWQKFKCYYNVLSLSRNICRFPWSFILFLSSALLAAELCASTCGYLLSCLLVSLLSMGKFIIYKMGSLLILSIQFVFQPHSNSRFVSKMHLMILLGYFSRRKHRKIHRKNLKNGWQKYHRSCIMLSYITL